MLVVCPIHGPQPGILISPDLLPHLEAQAHPDEVVDLVYKYQKQVAWVFHVSRDFAREHGLRGGVDALPEKGPVWVHDLQCCCKRCFEEKGDGYFDSDFRWHARSENREIGQPSNLST